MRYYKYIFLFILLLTLWFCGDSRQKQSIDIKEEAGSKTTPSVPAPVLKDSLIPVNLSQSDLPSVIQYKGTFYSAFKWWDKTGYNIIVLSTNSLSVEDKEFGTFENTGELFAKQFNLNNPLKPVLVWEMYDSQQKCIFDLTCAFITSDISDLDNDSIKETSIIYKLSCRSDARPAKMKLIMHEGKQKYALRGLMIFQMRDAPDSLFPANREIDISKVPAGELSNTLFRDWGCYENENNFKGAPPVFLKYAKQLWVENAVE